MTAQFLDNLISHLENRFAEHSRLAALGSNLVASVYLENPGNCTYCSKAISEFAKRYSGDMPFASDVIHLYLSLHPGARRWRLFLIHQTQLLTHWLPQTSSCSQPSSLLCIFSTIPVTTCECERSVSSLRHLKSYLRSTMGQERLSALALLNIHYSMEINLDQVISMFAFAT